MNGILKHLQQVKKSSASWRFPEGASDSDIREAEDALGFSIDEGYRTLLRFSNGPCIGGDGSTEFHSVARYGSNSLSEVITDVARSNRWLPITTDGCGNSFLLVTVAGVSGRPVGFFESQLSISEPQYLVASSFGNFLTFWLRDAMKADGWPFSREAFVEIDPTFPEVTPRSLLPWSTR